MLFKSKFWEERAAEAAAGRSSRGGRGLEAGEKMGLESLASCQHCPSLESQDSECRGAEGDSLTFEFSPGALHIPSGDRGSLGGCDPPGAIIDARSTGNDVHHFPALW